MSDEIVPFVEFDQLSVRPPVSTLKEAASILEKKSEGLILGEVIFFDDFDDNGRFRWGMYLRAPKLGNYRYRLLSIEHGVDFYPVKLEVNEDVLEEIYESEEFEPSELAKNPLYGSIRGFQIKTKLLQPYFFEVESEGDLFPVLDLIFNTKRVAKVINAIRAQIAA